jgi:hypothetical protein
MRLWTFAVAALATGLPAGAVIPVIWGNKEVVSHLAALPPPGGPVDKDYPDKVGYKYRRYHVFWVPVWTSEGEFIAYKSDTPGSRYYSLGADPDEAARLTGLPVEAFRVPWPYRFPPGLVVLVLLGLFLVFDIVRTRLSLLRAKAPPALARALAQAELAAMLPPSPEDLLAQPRYRHAMELACEGEEVTVASVGRALDHLIAEGVARHEAAQNLTLLLNERRARREAGPPETGIQARPS